ncbi:MAG: hypothetical protein M9921_11735 [Fimbriimonadaceae bacterium]|nr:hypothetical protein [Chthonomonadaceae bacterium]MCO5297518.1 hypothetical protein [Fimbriimonadaceae bacterium]
MCAFCSTTRPFLDRRLLERPEVRGRLEAVRARIASESPLHPCDDSVNWDWRAFLRTR